MGLVVKVFFMRWSINASKNLHPSNAGRIALPEKRVPKHLSEAHVSSRELGATALGKGKVLRYLLHRWVNIRE